MTTSAPAPSKALPTAIAVVTLIVVTACVFLGLNALHSPPAATDGAAPHAETPPYQPVEPAKPVAMGHRVDTSITLALPSGEVVYDERRTITLEEGALVPGLLEAIVGMTPGDEARVTITPDRAYGSRGRGSIPPDATLTATIVLHASSTPADGSPRPGVDEQRG
ncbi:MAG: FKBP-type peptidyl-prolyl cis-trans isomerase [Planctomycetota bacterium]